jgi:hypothetical protein
MTNPGGLASRRGSSRRPDAHVRARYELARQNSRSGDDVPVSLALDARQCRTVLAG